MFKGSRNVINVSTVSCLMVEEETQTIPSNINEIYTRFVETDETKNLSTKELKRLVLLEELYLIRIKKDKFLKNNCIS